MKNLLKALADFQQEVKPILKNEKGYGYNYADLGAILEVINPLLNKNGLGFTQPLNGTKLKTIIYHKETGEMIESECDLLLNDLTYEVAIKYDKQKGENYEVEVIKGFEGMNKAQAMGSMITYFRRYSLSSILGLVTDEDTDGSSKEKETYKSKTTFKNKVDVWLSEDAFNATKKLSKQLIKDCLNKYDSKTLQSDGKTYGMKKDYRTELTNLSK